MSNPLVAERKDSTQAFSGVPILESVDETKKAIESGDWASGVMGAVGTGLDALTMALDPFGSILAAGVGWLMEHVGPLSDALDELTGDADQIKAHSETWKNVAAELGEINTEMANLVSSDVADWTGDAADSYRQRSEDTGKLIEAAQKAAEGASDGIGTAGEVVAAVRTLVRDIIAELVGRLVSWALQVLATLGIAMAWVVPQVVAAVAKTVAKIADVTTKLVKAMKALGKLMKKLGDGFGDAKKALDKIKKDNGGSGNKPDSPTPDRPRGNDGPNKKSDNNDDPASTHSQSTGGNGGQGGGNGPTPDRPGGNGGSQNTDRSVDGGGPSGSNSRSPGGNPPPTRTESAGNNGRSARDDAVGTDKRNCKGDPVDVATGDVVLVQQDLTLPDRLDLVLERTHISSYRTGRWFGSSWTSTVDQRLETDDANVRYLTPDGMILVYPLPGLDQTVLPVEGPRWPLTRNADGTATITDDFRGRTLHFAAPRGQVLHLRTIESNDQRIDFEYDESGAPTSARHSAGVAVGFRTEHARITELRVLGGEAAVDVVVMRYRYDEAGRLIEVINASGLPLLFDYDAEGRLTGWQDRNGVWYRYVYDQSGRCVRTVGADGFLDATFSYDRERMLTTHTDSLGNSTVIQLNEENQTVQETNPLGHTTSFEWDRYDRLLSRTDALGRTTRFDYDADGRPWQLIRPDGSLVSLDYDHGGLLHSITVADADRSWRRFYGSASGQESGPDPLTDPIGVASQLMTARGDAAGPLPDATDRDQFGRPRSVPDGAGGRVQLAWTVGGMPSQRISERNERTTWRYDGEGNEVERMDELGRVSRTEYGPFDMPTATIDPAGGRTTYRYDTELRLVSITNPNGLTWHYAYDATGLLTEQIDFDGRIRRYGYDAAGQLVRSVDPEGRITEYHYDLLGNLVESHGPAGSTRYTYDPVGELLRVASADSVLEFERDRFGRVVRETIDGRSVTFSYDAERNTIQRRTPSGAESEWVFDIEDRPVELVGQGHTVRFGYDDAGQPVRRSVDDAYLLEQSFGSGGRLAVQMLTANGAPRQHRVFDYSPDGALAGMRDSIAGQTSLTRDGLGRITAVQAPGMREDFRYDRAGNVVEGQSAATAERGARHYAHNTVTAAGAVTYRTDQLGRRVSRREQDRVWDYIWDAADRLIGVDTPDGQRWRYRYDPLGRRTTKQRLSPDGAVAELVEFAWDGDVLIEQVHTDAFGARHVVTWDHHPRSDAPVAQRERGPRGDGFYSVITDAVGTPTELVDGAGEVAWYGRRTLWGRHLPATHSKTSTPLRFPGQYADDESGLHYNVHRYYDPETARYLSQDPLGLEAGPNPVAYPADPYAESDPLGLMNCGGTPPGGAPGAPGSKHNPGNTGGSADKPKPPPPPKKEKPLWMQNWPEGKPFPSSKPPAGKNEFTPAPEGTKFGNLKVEGTFDYKPDKQTVAGSKYSDVAPMQSSVNPNIIQEKIDALKASGNPAKIPVYYAPPQGQLSLYGDKHHTFAAAVQSGHPIELNLIKPPGGTGMANTRLDWSNVANANFEKPAWRK